LFRTDGNRFSGNQNRTLMTQLATMNLFVTRDADRLAVGNTESQTREVCPRFDMVGLQIAGRAAASAFVAVTPEYFSAPRCDARLVNLAFSSGRAAFPVPMTSSASGGIRTAWRAKFLSRITVKKRCAAKPAGAWLYRCANIPARLRAILGKCAVWLRLKGFATDHADSRDTTKAVFASDRVVAFTRAKLLSLESWLELSSTYWARIHACILQHESLCVKYCAVILERMATAFPSLTIERVCPRSVSPRCRGRCRPVLKLPLDNKRRSGRMVACKS